MVNPRNELVNNIINDLIEITEKIKEFFKPNVFNKKNSFLWFETYKKLFCNILKMHITKIKKTRRLIGAS